MLSNGDKFPWIKKATNIQGSVVQELFSNIIILVFDFLFYGCIQMWDNRQKYLTHNTLSNTQPYFKYDS